MPCWNAIRQRVIAKVTKAVNLSREKHVRRRGAHTTKETCPVVDEPILSCAPTLGQTHEVQHVRLAPVHSLLPVIQCEPATRATELEHIAILDMHEFMSTESLLQFMMNS